MISCYSALGCQEVIPCQSFTWLHWWFCVISSANSILTHYYNVISWCDIIMTSYAIKHIAYTSVWWQWLLFYSGLYWLCFCVSLHGCLQANVSKSYWFFFLLKAKSAVFHQEKDFLAIIKKHSSCTLHWLYLLSPVGKFCQLLVSDRKSVVTERNFPFSEMFETFFALPMGWLFIYFCQFSFVHACKSGAVVRSWDSAVGG